MADQNPQHEGAGVGGPDGAALEQAAQQVTLDRSSTEPGSQRYEDIQAAYTRSRQELVESQQAQADLTERQQWYELLVTSEDPDIRRQAAETLGFEFAEEEPPADGYEDPYDVRLGALERHNAEQQQRQQEAEQARELSEIVSARLEELLPGAANDPDIKFDQDNVWSLANSLPPTKEGLPDVDSAFAMLTARNDRRQQEWARSKRAPVFSPSGQTATEVPNLDNDQERQDYMTRRLQANMEP